MTALPELARLDAPPEDAGPAGWAYAAIDWVLETLTPWMPLLAWVFVGICVLRAAAVLVVWRARPAPDGVRDAAVRRSAVVSLLGRACGDRRLPWAVRQNARAARWYLDSDLRVAPWFVPGIRAAEQALVTAWILRRLANSREGDVAGQLSQSERASAIAPAGCAPAWDGPGSVTGPDSPSAA